MTHHSFSVKCMPQTDERQRILQQELHILPNRFLCGGRDSFGNEYVFGRTEEPHDLFEVELSGLAETGLAAGITADRDYCLGMYGAQTDYTRPSDSLRQFLDSLCLEQGMTELEKSEIIMKALYGSFHYEKGRTDVTTAAAQAWELGCGVCQDYAHIMLSLCRSCGIRCRYVAGLLIGEGLSHAWVEVASGRVWYGLDPTNNMAVSDNHIKISHGRDCTDCRINQGVFTGNARQQQTVAARVWEINGPEER